MEQIIVEQIIEEVSKKFEGLKTLMDKCPNVFSINFKNNDITIQCDLGCLEQYLAKLNQDVLQHQ